ncbi:MAG: YvcK family protein [Clostridia bacterium]|nr:YvcK family protein [Clostridia bacterium]
MIRKKVVVLGGGTGTSTLLSGLKRMPIDITAVISVSDNGSSTGKLREEFLIPAVGDIRKVLTNLSPLPDEVKAVMEERLKTTSDLNGHAIGNLALTAYLKKTESLEKSIRLMSKLLGVKQTVLPLSEDLLTLVGETIDGEFIEGEEQIDEANKKYKRIFYKEEPHVTPSVLTKIKQADLVVLSMGSLYTSLIPNLICKDIVDAIKESNAKVLYICNLFTQVGVTDHFTVSDHINAIENYIGKDGVNCVIVNDEKVSEEFLKKYRDEENKEFVRTDDEVLKDKKCEIIKSNLITTEDGTVKHNTLKLSSIIFSYLFR